MNIVSRSIVVGITLTITSASGVSAATTLIAASTVCPAPQPASNMSATFASEFTKMTGLNTNQWRQTIGVHGSVKDELQAFVASDSFIMSNGAGLRLKTERNATLGRPYTSGQVTTRGLFSQTYGHFEMMAKVPEANGMWPAFWLLPENGAWPPEIDILEYIYAPNGVLPAASATATNFWLGSNPASTLHYGASNNQIAPAYNSNIQPTLTYQDWNSKPAPAGWTSAYTGYHIYAVDWRPGNLTYFVDNAPVFCVNDNQSTGMRVPDGPMYVLLTQAVTAGTQASPAWAGYVAAGQSFPLDMDIAYVRVSQFRDIGPQPALPLDISNILLSKQGAGNTASLTVRAGDQVTISGTLAVGAQDLGFSAQTYFTIKGQDGSTYDGLGSNVATIPVTAIKLNPNQKYTVSTTYNVPSGIPAGVYSIGLQSTYTSSLMNGDGVAAPRGVNNPQLALMNVAP